LSFFGVSIPINSDTHVLAVGVTMNSALLLLNISELLAAGLWDGVLI